MYHSISSDAGSSFRPFSLSPEMFGRQMDYLNQQGYTPITMSHLAQTLAGDSEGFPENPIVLTFDDGFGDFYTDAFPVLKAYGYVATLFVATAYVGGTSTWLQREGEADRAMVDWPHLAEVAGSGIECGAHCHQHLELDTLPPVAARAQIERSKKALEERLSCHVVSFAYPFGYYSGGLKSIVRAAGFTSACAVGDAVSSASDDLFALPRLWVKWETDVARLGDTLASHDSPALRRLRVFAAQIRWFCRRNTTRLRHPSDHLLAKE